MSANIQIPETLKPVQEMAYNLWFAWNYDAREMFKTMDEALWHQSAQNPVKLLNSITENRLHTLAGDAAFLEKMNTVYERFNGYINNPKTRFSDNYSYLTEQMVAYFSAEYGLHESLPNYAGGLGILAGDHCKTASDLGLPFVAVGLMYKFAYFDQTIDEHGNQQEHYKKLNPDELPVQLVKDDNEEPLLVSVPILDREVWIKIWEARIGRISLYLLDTDVENNSEEDCMIIHSLYGGTRDTRIKQEIVLGIGGLRALRAMGYQPVVYHMNEGHSAFLGLERLYELMNDGMAFRMALEYVRSTTLFTTHTPIPAGNEAFEFDLMERYFKNFWPKLEMSDDFFFDLGRNFNEHQHENFSLTVLALNLSHMANGVSKLHGEISRSMWQKVYPAIPKSEVPIGHVTNGVHTESWLHPNMVCLFDRYLGNDWRQHLHDENYWDQIADIPDEEFWQTMLDIKKEMTDHLRSNYHKQMQRLQHANHDFPNPEDILDEEILTIGFARRFAPYKRAALIFRDIDRLKKLIQNADRPFQIIFSGKAHPHNDAGKELIRVINKFATDKDLNGRVVFIENYGIDVSRSMVSGVDVWLNNPRRPLEASGTSGQKVPINGGINLSVLDGWWPEGYNGGNGWTIGYEIDYGDHNKQDQIDADSLYNTLENEILPLFYNRDENNVPTGWVRMAKESLRSVITKFSTHTMVWNYITEYYVPGIKRGLKYVENDYAMLFKFNRWQNRLKRHWPKLQMQLKNGNGMEEDKRIFSSGETKEIGVLIDSEGLHADDLQVEIIMERQDSIMGEQSMKVYPMGLVNQLNGSKYEFRTTVQAGKDGSYRLNCRALPKHADFFDKHELRLIKWLD
ncbi:MAG: alpha-glucan family phosphorylase [Caldithrix sp.]|nr:alpha-glucan family phosphorylase [Caldithrix sp.]